MNAPTASQTFRATLFSAPDPWRSVALLFALIVALPLLVLLASLLKLQPEIWQHLRQYVLPELIVNTLWLAIGVGVGSAIIGVSLAWLTVVHDFPGRKIFSWALLLPLALPAYVTAFVSIGFLDYTGPLQTAMRHAFGAGNWLPPIRSRGGVTAVMTLAFYPYVYLLARNAFLTQGKSALEAAQSLGLSRTWGFFKVALPMARPWIASGVLLVIMETCADFGTVATFNYDTFTTAIYKTWFGMFSLPAASQLASLLVMVVFALVIAEQLSRTRMSFNTAGKSDARFASIPLQGKGKWLATFYASSILLLAFLLPVAQLAVWAWHSVGDLDSRYIGFLFHSLLLAALAAALITACAFVLSYAQRRHTDTFMRVITRIATLGYAVPGAVLAVGFFVPVAWVDNHLIALYKKFPGEDAGAFLQGTLLIMLAAYLVRFMAVGFNPVDAAMQRVTPHIDDAARSLGITPRQMLLRVHLPMLRGGLATAAIMVFVDVMKEMPITLMTRPFGWDTLAVRIFELTSEGQWEQAALPALALVLAGMIPIILLVRQSEK